MANDHDPTREEALAEVRRISQEMRESYRKAPKLNQLAVKLLLIAIVLFILVGVLGIAGG